MASRKDEYDRQLAKYGPRRPGFDVRAAARTHASVASLLGGFAFAAVVLVANASGKYPQHHSCTPPVSCHVLADDRAVPAFLVAVLCLVLAAFAFAAISGEELMARRCHKAMGFAAGGFLAGIATVFWGLSCVADAFFSGYTSSLADVAFVIFAGLGPVYVGSTVFDAKSAFDELAPGCDRWKPTGRDYLLYLPAIGMLVISLILRFILGSQIKVNWLLETALLISVAVGVVGILGSFAASVQADPDGEWRAKSAWAWLALVAVPLSLLVILMPP